MVGLFGASLAVCGEQYKVGTATEKGKVLLEEFTGLNCAYCSDGHAVAAQMLRLMPGQAYVVAVNAGSFSKPNSGQADYRTAEGTALANYMATEEAGYPCGTVNRRLYDGQNYLCGRDKWIKLAKSYVQDDAIVNLYAEAQYDGDTRTLTVHVEGYYTAAVPSDSVQRLNVAWTQDDITGYQNGSGAGSEYVHNHMLRGYISPMWGDEIEGAAKGQYFTKDYACTLPEAVNDIQVKPEDINIIAFVTTGKTNVENVTGVKPSYINYATTEAGELRTPDFEIGTRYGYNFFEAKLKNRSSKQISSATVEVTVNGHTCEETVDCDIDQFATATLRIPATMDYAQRGKTKYTLTLKQLNGVDVVSDTIGGSYQRPASTNSSVHIEMATDLCASEDAVCLKDADGNVLREFGPYTDGTQHTIDETIDGLEHGQTYCFEVYDTAGNGLLEGKKGNITIHSGQGKLIDQYYTISGFGLRSFFTVDTTDGIDTVEADTASDCRLYNTAGQRIDNAPRGTLVIKVDSKGVARKTIKQ